MRTVGVTEVREYCGPWPHLDEGGGLKGEVERVRKKGWSKSVVLYQRDCSVLYRLEVKLILVKGIVLYYSLVYCILV